MPAPRLEDARPTAALARLASVAAAIALLAALLVSAVVAPSGARATGPLPACRYADILTTPRAYADWSVTLVDTILRVQKAYAPPDLVSTSKAGITGGGQIRAITIDDLRAMTEAAALAGNPIAVQSAYRSYASQQSVFNGWVSQLGYARALEVSARPGHSEHQLGLGIDFKTETGGSPFTGRFEFTAQAKWLKAHAWEYGWVLSYPKGKMAVTCYDFEPWHYRYVGRDVAALIHASGLTPRQYLWANATTTVVPPAPKPTKVPGRTAAPSASPAPSPTLAPSPSPAPTFPPSPSPAPTVTVAPSASTSPETPAPATTPAPGVSEPAGTIAPAAVAGGAAVLLGAGVLGLWLARRRGRSGVGL